MNDNLKRRLKVYPNIRECAVQTFNDQQKEEKSQSRIITMTDENLQKCEKLQTLLPYGIFFSVNPMEEWKRNKESVKKIQTWIVDIDEWTKDEQLDLIGNAPLLPSLVVESVHGFHLYYLAEDELTIEEYETGNQWLRDYYNWDQKVVKDTARVLRLPWFYHQKGEKVMVVFREDLSCQDRYTPQQIFEAFPRHVVEQPKVEVKPIERMWSGSETYRQKVNQLDNRQILNELSGTRFLDWQIISYKPCSTGEQIYCDGKQTSCRIDRSWMIWSYDDGWPTWIQYLRRYERNRWIKLDWRELAKWLNANHPELEDKKTKPQKIDLEKVFDKPKTPVLKKPDFSWWDKWLDDAIWKLSRWQLVILTWETWAGKTTFATFMARKNPNSCYFVLEDSLENIAKRYALKRAWITKKELNEWTWWDYKQQQFDEAFTRFANRETKFVDVWHKIDIASLIDTMRQLKEKWYWMFFIDNLGFVIWEWTTEADQTADISAKLVEFCLSEDVCVVLLHHFKKWDWMRRRDIWQLRWSGKLWDDAFFVANYNRQDEWTLLEVFKDRNRWELEIYLLEYDRWDFKYLKKYD